MCGEQGIIVNFIIILIGSPPRVRGTGAWDFSFIPLPGITPACAGNSYVSVKKPCMKWDHPRVCGEQLCALELALT